MRARRIARTRKPTLPYKIFFSCLKRWNVKFRMAAVIKKTPAAMPTLIAYEYSCKPETLEYLTLKT
jgi:hypothetical protein